MILERFSHSTGLLRTLPKFAILGVIALSAVGCGGHSSTAIGTNSYSGTWSGTITSTTASPTGGAPITTTQSLSVVISPTGTVTGTDTATIPGTGTTDTGTIDSNGDLSLVIDKAGTSVQLASLAATLDVVSNTLEGGGSLTIGTISTPISISLGLTSTASAVHKK